MPLYDKILLRKRSVIETINDELKNVAQLVHSRHRSVFNFVMNVLSVLAAYSFFEKKPSINIDYCIVLLSTKTFFEHIKIRAGFLAWNSALLVTFVSCCKFQFK